MKATDILKEEHRVIERVLSSLESAAHKLRSGTPIRPGFFVEATDFIKGFADGCHHKKEEGVLFKAMISSGMPAEGGPISVMLSEHEQGRAYTRSMREAAQKLEAGDASFLDKVVSSARNYVSLLREHINKEDHVLFPMAEQVIPPGQWGKVAEDFEHIEHEETGAGVHEMYLALAKKLEEEVKK